ncbi:hypothetical protein BO99DRAFT_433331 [Aspergillus violaceofuscus CBS 115571]|uniref:Stress-response A/B barrel domain-containing protein n=1 Tax=Aspergillus violaceofuscus (strain CBS 115571) TaxID=1450538 RepID=A0A2V5H512_ASPV1|nr:hypothetical protein BO99DRAFT_433331 [Aspergillus violaceofuscus CBS 115571]
MADNAHALPLSSQTQSSVNPLHHPSQLFNPSRLTLLKKGRKHSSNSPYPRPSASRKASMDPPVTSSNTCQILQEFMTRPQKCKDQSGRLYIRSIRGGVECTPEVSSDNSHVFIVEFGSLQDRDFYKNVIPRHAEFASRIIPLVNLTTMAVFEESDFAEV